LKSFIEKKPSALLQFGKEGKNMLIRFLAVEAGFEYLEEINFIEPEVEQWRSFQNLQYAVDVDADLDEAFSEHVYENAGKKGAILPPHMYGGLAKTERGCRYVSLKAANSYSYSPIRYVESSRRENISKKFGQLS